MNKGTHLTFYKEGLNFHIYEIMRDWYRLSKETGDGGSCVLGAGFSFNFNGSRLFMPAQSPYQGSLSWESGIEFVKNRLVQIGATNIIYCWGTLD